MILSLDEPIFSQRDSRQISVSFSSYLAPKSSTFVLSIFVDIFRFSSYFCCICRRLMLNNVNRNLEICLFCCCQTLCHSSQILSLSVNLVSFVMSSLWMTVYQRILSLTVDLVSQVIMTLCHFLSLPVISCH